ncbi:heterokaryon incompatibility [Hyphodiscus hymeniophilus]|uniref:Heterokaryon incompatibility n=1 Tax=Hyphodiscus hymeniophilus TaxID=353542 RepID=A0A9P7B0M9_9HELO|nr:heterokaryon incompatibility [Hyphodiscus hymeniophilus]
MADQPPPGYESSPGYESPPKYEYNRYRPLKANEIRVVRFDEIWPRDKTFSATLQYINLEDNPVYFALSYTWGDASREETILLDDQPFKVTVNLYDALHQIRDNAAYFQGMVEQDLQMPCNELLLWVDAICIDQSNRKDKEQQLPRMGSIYSSAHNVLVWLGRNEGTIPYPIGFDAFLRECHKMDSTTSMHVFQILDLPWFTRLWTVQEYLLGQRQPLGLPGSGVFVLQSIYDLVEASLPSIVDDTSGELRQRLSTVLGNLKGKLVKLRLLNILRNKIKAEAFQQASFADQMNSVLIRTTVDEAKLPASLRPSYDKPFGDVCYAYVKHIIDATGNLDILFCMKTELVGYPSWVSDLRYRSPSSGPSGVPHTKNQVSWSPDGQGVAVEGASLGNILAYSCNEPEENTSHTKVQSSNKFGHIHSQLKNFYDTILTASAWLRGLNIQDVWHEYLSPYEQLFGCETDYLSMEDFLAARLDDPDTINATKFSERNMLIQVKRHFSNQKYALMHNGQLLLRWPTVDFKAKQYST